MDLEVEIGGRVVVGERAEQVAAGFVEGGEYEGEGGFAAVEDKESDVE